MMPSERERIDHYRITRKIGQGGMGIVYAAHDERLDRQVAIKMILDAGADVTARERFWREARAAAAVSHPHVCQLYEIDTMHAILNDRPPVLTGSSTVDAVDRIIQRALEKRAAARYQRARYGRRRAGRHG